MSNASDVKKCQTCKQEKPITEFHLNPDKKDGRCRACKACRRAYDQKYYYRPERLERTWSLYIQRKFGVTINQYYEALKAQNGSCAICRSESPRNGRSRFAIDHDHATGKIRGLLCMQCNTAIGLFRDNQSLLISTIAYLEKFK